MGGLGMREWSLRTRLTVLFSVLTGAILCVVAVAALRHFENEYRRTSAKNQHSLTAAMAREADSRLQAAVVQLSSVAEAYPRDALGDPPTAEQTLSAQKGALVTFDRGILLLSPRGPLGFVGPSPPPTFAEAFEFSALARNGAPHLYGPFPDESSTRAHIVVAAPIRDEDGATTAVLLGGFDATADRLLGSLPDLRIAEGGHFFLRGPDHGVSLSGAPVREAAAAKALLSEAPLAVAGWSLSAEISLPQAPIRSARLYIVGALGALAPLCTLIVWLFMRRLTAPLAQIGSRVKAITEGETELAPLPVAPHEEIALLTNAFNTMQEEIVRRGRAIEEQKEFAEALVQYAAAPIFVIDRHHKVISWNKACEELTGLCAAELKGTDLQWRGFYEHPRPCLADFVVESRYDELSDYFSAHSPARLVGEGLQAEGWRKTPGGRVCYLIFSAAPIRNNRGEIVAAIETLEDITERKNAETRLKQMAHFDFLTGLPNRALFFDRLEVGVDEAKRYGHRIALLFIDLNGFKEINDSLGHDAGDVALAELAQRLKGCVRTCDTVARMGGDEFTVILGRITEPKEAALVTRRIADAFASPVCSGDLVLTLGASIGISVYPEDGTDGATLLKKADTAMYRAKARGGGILFAAEGEPFYRIDEEPWQDEGEGNARKEGIGS